MDFGEGAKTIACLGWGSLVWDPRGLPIRGTWFHDGPLLPIEFARQSCDGRLTLVLVPEYQSLVRSMWSLFSLSDVHAAREALRKREGVLSENREKHIGMWAGEQSDDPIPQEIAAWARGLRLSAVVWTALPPRFRGQECSPTPDEAVAYLRGLTHEKRRYAERYVRMAPRQVDTPYRRRFEAEFGWTPVEGA